MTRAFQIRRGILTLALSAGCLSVFVLTGAAADDSARATSNDDEDTDAEKVATNLTCCPLEQPCFEASVAECRAVLGQLRAARKMAEAAAATPSEASAPLRGFVDVNTITAKGAPGARLVHVDGCEPAANDEDGFPMENCTVYEVDCNLNQTADPEILLWYKYSKTPSQGVRARQDAIVGDYFWITTWDFNKQLVNRAEREDGDACSR